MSDRALIRAGLAGAVLAGICSSAPLIAVSLPLAGLGAWLAGTSLVMLPLLVASLGLVAWAIHRRRPKAADRETKIHKEGVKP
ncbi:mercury transport protein [Bradyrhizobium sp. Leaf401]|uniref:mercury transport protein n=1 Tax=Bradyrhizobium sp. Leaf401 TaxID=2876564 RepID=UPI001E3EA110|nr:mercury transport protein [Bradyrhizobium sp. Leaf401]